MCAAASKGCSKVDAVATSSLLQIDGLTRRFGGVVAADAITLDIPPGDVHAVIGPNGAGKTTLVGLIARKGRLGSWLTSRCST